MCGISGIWRPQGCQAELLEAQIRTMTDRLRHRGPDDGGNFIDPDASLALGHRRLSIVDLSDTGKQPMSSANGQYVLTFNGEIYNHCDLRVELAQDGVAFTGTSDTEVLLGALTTWGVERTLDRVIGMFAFGLWDRSQRSLILARDRVGIKPLYWGWHQGTFVFASELKAIKRRGLSPDELDHDAIATFLKRGYVPAPNTIYRDIYKLAPGHILHVTEGLARERVPNRNIDRHLKAYWSSTDSYASASELDAFSGDAEAIERLDELIRDSVAVRMVADVPVGAFLSGGVDSSLVVAQMQRQTSRQVKTFTIGFHEAAHDEAHHARRVAAHLGTDHHELYVAAADALAVVPSLPDMFDEPFADPAAIPTFLVSRLAETSVKVALSGDGGDELFAGYDRYGETQRLVAALARIPLALRRPFGHVLERRGTLLHTALQAIVRHLPARMQPSRSGDTLDILARLASSTGPDDVYDCLMSHWHDPSMALRDAKATRHKGDATGMTMDSRRLIDRLMLSDFTDYLPNDCLTKLDRTSMSTGLEARVPLLDHRLAEFAWSLPLHMKYRDGENKWALRQILRRHLPAELANREKKGFSVPVGDWISGPLLDWTESLLSTDRLDAFGIFNTAAVRKVWLDHRDGKGASTQKLWSVLMLQGWLDSHVS